MATSNDQSVENYLDQIPGDRKAAMEKLRKTILKNIPKGFRESVTSGMIAYSVPHSKYPNGYHCKPEQEVPFVCLANQKNFIAIYHMGIYASPKVLAWFNKAYPLHSKRKLDMGKSCIRFKDLDDIPFELIGELMKKFTVDDWIETYESAFRKK